jgi:dipeptidyl aminopeptidase/acylaminoacyl peptidase
MTPLADEPCAAHALDYGQYTAKFQEENQRQIDRDTAVASANKDTSPEALASIQKHRDEIRARKPVDQAAFDRAFHGGFACRRVTYASGGLRVIAYTVRSMPASGQAPVLVFLRGGNRELGRVDEQTIARWLIHWAQQGYVVVAPQYRQADGGEGTDEMGGADVDDVLALLPLVKSLPNVDPAELFVYGVSRGGMMAYQALRRGLPARAAVIHSGLADVDATLKERPEFEAMYREMIPNYTQDRAAAIARRSAVQWVAELKVPLLILAGSADWRVSASQALHVAETLQAAGREYGLIVYPGDDHGLSKNVEDVRLQSQRWFAAHRRPR